MATAAAARLNHASASCAAPREARAHGLAPRRRGALRVQAVAEFVHRAADRKEAILLAKVQGHSASTAAALVLRDTGKRPAGWTLQSGAWLWAMARADHTSCYQGLGATPAAAAAPACARPTPPPYPPSRPQRTASRC